MRFSTFYETPDELDQLTARHASMILSLAWCPLELFGLVSDSPLSDQNSSY